MSPVERKIKKAKIKDTGCIINDTDDFFENRQKSYLLRERYSRGNLNFQCLCCDQDLAISKSTKNNIFLKHKPNSQYCELKDAKLSAIEIDFFYDALVSKESARHKLLKNRIGELLREDKNFSEVRIDDVFISNNKGEKRRPDVYCKYLDKEIVFEIQLSKLSHKYIIGRHDFYKDKGIYLIWILDDFDVKKSSSMELDIKYLSINQCFFSFNPDVDRFKLECNYKSLRLVEETNEIESNWQIVNITFDKLKFDDVNYQIYFYPYKKKLVELNKIKNKIDVSRKNELEQKKIEKESAAILKQIQKEQDRRVQKVHNFIEEVAYQKNKRKDGFFVELESDLQEFDNDELRILNNKLNLLNKNRIHNWTVNLNKSQIKFLDFILNPRYIEFDLNKLDSNSNSIFHYVLENKNFPNILIKEELIKLFFKKGYKFNEKDRVELNSYLSLKNQTESYEYLGLIYEIANDTPNWLIDELFEIKSRIAIIIIESFLRDKLYYFNYKSNIWLRLAQNAIEHYPNYWEEILLAVKYSGKYEYLLKRDKKGKLKRKIDNFTIQKNHRNEDFNQLFIHLYPELVYST